MLKLYRGLKKYTGQLVLLVLLLLGQVFSLLMLPNMMSSIIDQGVVLGDIGYIARAGLVMLAITLAGSACAIGVGYFASRIGVGFCTDVRKELFHKVGQFTMAEFDQVGTASLTTRTTNDIMQIQDFTIMMFRVIILAPIMCVGGIAMALQKNMQLAMVIIACMPLIVAFLVIVMRKVFPIFRSVQSKLDHLNLIMRENVTGVRVIRAFTAEKREEERFAKANAELTKTSVKSQVLLSTLMPLLMLIVNLGTIAVVWFGGQQIAQGSLMVGDLMAFIQYLVLIMYALVMMSLIFAMMPRASVCADRINEVMAITPNIKESTNPKAPKDRTGEVEFRDVTFRYGGAENPAVSNISFTAKPGCTTAIIGATGSGKSSIIMLIPRLYDVSEGAVLVDGVDVRDYDIHALRNRIGYVPQKAVLFSGTIRGNIAYENEEMPITQVEKAAEIAQADSFIEEKQKGYDDPIAQGGTNVSGGQKQRLSIARALAGDASIYIFDDSFSALDFKTDASLRKALKKNTKGATVIIVAQRINTIMDADNILVVDEGRIIGQGTHQELIQSCEVYAEIARTQMS
ncbi:MAG: ABC transporter ATP-binding protein [Christensenella sp.]|nr:ABC transporter ATP-binding protein [Christensenella sp.]